MEKFSELLGVYVYRNINKNILEFFIRNSREGEKGPKKNISLNSLR